MNLIAITGKARSGKDSIAEHLVASHEYTRIAFADPLKSAAQKIFGLSDAQTWDAELKEVEVPYWGMTPRRIFQLLGTEAIMGTFGPDIWVKRFKLSLNEAQGAVVVPDCRFDLEAEAIRNLGGAIIEVIRGPGLNGSEGEHASEAGLSTLSDVTFSNNDTLSDLKKKVDNLITETEKEPCQEPCQN